MSVRSGQTIDEKNQTTGFFKINKRALRLAKKERLSNKHFWLHWGAMRNSTFDFIT